MPAAISNGTRADARTPQPNPDPFNYDAAVDDFLRDLPLDGPTDSLNGAVNNNNNGRDSDDEIKIRKQRQPIPKLDEARLLSDRGIPRLRRIAKTKIKFKGKGHEFTDVARLLDMYQLWLDDLYPRAKFRDALTMVEKLGHSKRMQVTRREWLDATKPRVRAASEERLEHEPHGTLAPHATRAPNDDTADEEMPDRQSPDHDELDDILRENDTAVSREITSKEGRRKGPFEEDEEEPDEDELDALLANETSANANHAAAAHPHNDFADEEEAMAEMDW